MDSNIKRCGIAALAGAVLLTSATAAIASPAAVAASTATTATSTAPPDCFSACERLLQPGQEVVVGAPYFAVIPPYYNPTINITGNANRGGAVFDVRYSVDGASFTRIMQSQGPSANAFGAVFYMPGFFRVVAENPKTTSALVTVTITGN